METHIPSYIHSAYHQPASGPQGAARQQENQSSGDKLNSRTSTQEGNRLSPNELEPEEQRLVNELKMRDREVRNHEAAHMAAAAGLIVRGANFSYQQGPDNKRYAVGGDVRIDVSPVAGDPEATISKSEQIRRAALAPANPSAQDISVAAMATRMAAEARIELAQQQNASRDSANNSIQSYLSTQQAAPSSQFQDYA